MRTLKQPLRGTNVLRLFALALTVFGLLLAAQAQLKPGSPWPKFHGNARNTGLSTSTTISNGALKWYVPVSYGCGSPAISSDGTVYVGDGHTNDYAVDAETGEIKWHGRVNSTIVQSPAVGANGYIYFSGGSLYATNPLAYRSWIAPFSYSSPPAIGPDGTVYIDDKNGLYAVDPLTGAQKWSFLASNPVATCPAIGADGTVYAGLGSNLYAVDGQTGAQVWSFAAKNTVTSPAIGPNGTFYVSSRNGDVIALNSSGAQLWSSNIGDIATSVPSLGPDGTVYVCSFYGHVVALDGATGALKWNFDTKNIISAASPAISSDGTVYIGNEGNQFFALDGATGAPKWIFNTGGEILTNPAIGADGTVYFGCSDSKLYALGYNEITGLSAQQTTMQGGSSTTGTVQILSAPGNGGTPVKLSSDNPHVIVPGTATVPNGQTAATFTINSLPVAVADSATITATIGTSSKQMSISLTPELLAGFTVSPTTIPSGGNTTGTVQLSSPTGNLGQTVSLKSDHPAVNMPATVLVPSGATGANFTIGSQTVLSTSIATLTATLGTTSKQTTLTLTPVLLSGLSVNPSTFEGSTSSVGMVEISSAAPSNGLQVGLKSGAAAAAVPANVTVPAASTTASFTVTSTPVSVSTNVTLTATLGASTKQTVITITPAQIADFTVSPASIQGGTSAQGTVVLDAPPGLDGDRIYLSSDNPAVNTPSSFVIQTGHQSKTFTVTSSAVSSTQIANLTARIEASSKQVSVTVYPDAPLLRCYASPSSIQSGSNTPGAVELAGKAVAGGQVVALQASSSAVTLPSSVTVPAGKSIQGFLIKSTSLPNAQTITLTATYKGVSVEGTLSLYPFVPIWNFYASPATVYGSQSSRGVVQLGAKAPAGGALVSLQSSSPDVQIPSSITISEGVMGVSFPIAVSAVASPETVTLTATYGLSVKQTTLTLLPNVLTAFYVSPTSTRAGTFGVLQIAAPAPPGGAMINLTCDALNYVYCPLTVVIPEGKTGLSFYMYTVRVYASKQVTMTASYGGVTRKAVLTLLPN